MDIQLLVRRAEFLHGRRHELDSVPPPNSELPPRAIPKRPSCLSRSSGPFLSNIDEHSHCRLITPSSPRLIGCSLEIVAVCRLFRHPSYTTPTIVSRFGRRGPPSPWGCMKKFLKGIFSTHSSIFVRCKLCFS
jgi:hypothetical protein